MLAGASSTSVYHAILVGGRDVEEGVRLALPPPWCVHCCECLDQAKLSFLSFQSCVILCEAYPGTHSWRDVFEWRNRTHPSAPMIVILRFPDERLWLEVLDNGGFDVLVFPFEREEITHIVGSAVLAANELLIVAPRGGCPSSDETTRTVETESAELAGFREPALFR